MATSPLITRLARELGVSTQVLGYCLDRTDIALTPRIKPLADQWPHDAQPHPIRAGRFSAASDTHAPDAAP